MKERPILFSSSMVRALLAGTKTQTRRVVKRQPPAGATFVRYDPDSISWDAVTPARPMGGNLGSQPQQMHFTEHCPYGAPGDRLWVRETWNTFEGWAGYFYAADDHSFGIGADDDPDHIPEHAVRWRPSIHMPRWASRITLEITAVRVERLQDIDHDDARAEGCIGDDVDSPAGHYETLWEQINGAGSWAANPWVWVVSFRRIES